MASFCTDRARVTDLIQEAQSVAERRGHRLSVFSSARHDRFRYVSFCTACGGLVVVDLDPRDSVAVQRMYGYALEANCTRDRQSSPYMPGIASMRR